MRRRNVLDPSTKVIPFGNIGNASKICPGNKIIQLAHSLPFSDKLFKCLRISMRIRHSAGSQLL